MIHQKKDPKLVTEKAWKQYCMPASADLIFKSKSLYFILEDEEAAVEKKQEKIKKEEQKVQEEIVQK